VTRYFDASALAKRYVRETGSTTVRRLLASGSVATSRLSEVEVSSAIVRRAREGAFTIDERDRMLAALQHDVPALAIVELTPEITADARTLLVRYPLRAGDAVQLASALYLQRQLARPVPFVAYDRRLVLAAREGGLVTGARGGPPRDVPKAVRIVKQVGIGNPPVLGDTIQTNVIRRSRTRKPRRPQKG
jgi:predicted nucleic acid-binding protein